MAPGASNKNKNQHSSQSPSTRATELQKVVLHPQVFANVRLVEHDHRGGVEILAVLGRLRRHAEAERHVAHAVHNGAPVLGSVLRYSPQAGLLHVVTIQKGHLRAGLHPHLVLRFVRAADGRGEEEGDPGGKNKIVWVEGQNTRGKVTQ